MRRWFRVGQHHHKSTARYCDVVVWPVTRFVSKENPTTMATVTLIDGQSVVATLGVTRDAKGNPTTDPVAAGTATWTLSDTTDATVTPSEDTLSATVTVNATAGAVDITLNVAATTVAGAAVTGSGVVAVTAGPAVTVDVDFGAPTGV